MESGEIPKNGTPVVVELFQQDGELEVGMVHNSPACTPTILIYYYNSYPLTDAQIVHAFTHSSTLTYAHTHTDADVFIIDNVL